MFRVRTFRVPERLQASKPHELCTLSGQTQSQHTLLSEPTGHPRGRSAAIATQMTSDPNRRTAACVRKRRVPRDGSEKSSRINRREAGFPLGHYMGRGERALRESDRPEPERRARVPVTPRSALGLGLKCSAPLPDFLLAWCLAVGSVADITSRRRDSHVGIRTASAWPCSNMAPHG